MSILSAFVIGTVAGAAVLGVLLLAAEAVWQWMDSEATQAFLEGRYLDSEETLLSLV